MSGRWFHLGRPLEAADFQEHPEEGLVVVGRYADGTVVSFEPEVRTTAGLPEPRRVG